jgi:L-asparagine transporter-like permease
MFMCVLSFLYLNRISTKWFNDVRNRFLTIAAIAVIGMTTASCQLLIDNRKPAKHRLSLFQLMSGINFVASRCGQILLAILLKKWLLALPMNYGPSNRHWGSHASG